MKMRQISPELYMACWGLTALLVLIADYFSGPYIRFPLFYLIPIFMATRWHGLPYGIALSIGMPLVRLLFATLFWKLSWTTFDSAINTVIRMAALAIYTILIHHVTTQARVLAKEVRILEGILPICSFCKKIRNSEGKWEILEKFVGEHSEANFSHGLCPECLKKNYPEFTEDWEKEGAKS